VNRVGLPLTHVLPRPPSLGWGWVLVIGIITGGLFWLVWIVVQAAWVRRATGKSAALWFAVGYLALHLCLFGVSLARALGAMDYSLAATILEDSSILGYLGHAATASLIWMELRSPRIGLWVHGMGNYFFGPVYFQYCLRDVRDVNQIAP
jgi:hypothetical protein